MKYKQEKYWRYIMVKKKEKEMTLGEACRTILNGLRDTVLGLMSPKGFKLDDGGCCQGKCKNGMTPVKPKRARTKGGKYKADDKKTKDVNEAWVGGKAPKKKAKRKTKGKK